jgi:uncharacterized protein (TIGR03118 family)
MFISGFIHRVSLLVFWKEETMFSSHQPRLRKRLRKTVRPNLECLEDRVVPADAPLTVQGVSIAPTQGSAFNGTVAIFSDADPQGNLSQYSATVSWGDGTTSSSSSGVQIVAAANVPHQFDVIGTHTYTSTGTFNLTVTVSDSGGAQATTGFINQTNLVSNLDTVGAANVDPNLVNSWGITHSPTSPWWVADNGTGVSTIYDSSGNTVRAPVTIPPPSTNPTGTAAPTGIVFNSTTDFVVGHGNTSPALFIFATEDGTISAWNGSAGNNAVLEVDNTNTDQTTSPVYKGLALASTGSANFLYATNFRDGTIDVFDKNFNKVTLGQNGFGTFTDPNLPAGYAPFGIQNINGNLYVTYALQNDAKHDDVKGAGHGFVDIYTPNGTLVQRLISQGSLNSPWGLALAPANFGAFSNDLLVGNFGDGTINAFNLKTGAFLGTLVNSTNTPISINGLWGIGFGNNAAAGSANTLFFASGLNDEADGLFGSLSAVVGGQAVVSAPAPVSTPATVNNQLVADVFLVHILQTSSEATTTAQQAFGSAFLLSSMQSAQETQMLVIDEIFAMIDFLNTFRGGGTSDLISRQISIANNPIYSTPVGYTTGLLVGVLVLNALL